MASHYDLEEQEQIAQLKAFWAKYGNLITWLLTAVLGAYAAYNGWQYWAWRQATQAAALLDELDQAARAADVERVRRAWGDLQAQAPRTAQAQHGALLAARTLA
ncbi:MAG: YfgM family protein, partial [Tepidimonas sp.]|uniref:YfgM family protein n=1 Tax=Tepidimonas sp. TaxID=2002775 RepID=UPI004054F624